MTKTNSKIFNPKKIPSIKRSGNVLTKVFINKKTGSRSMISGVTSIPNNKSINLHYHNCEEAVLVLEGTAVAEINYKKYTLKKGQVSWIPAKIPHRFINNSKKKLKIYWTYASANATRTDVATGKAHKILDEHKKK
jgi:putative monooxygenase|tara:strand:+ start:2511 stop:2918 length:408 start_codon:yes stop_codon:yes gene_type:complete